MEKRNELFAKEYKDDKIIYTMASGAGYGATYMQSICIFMGNAVDSFFQYSQWEFFHGPFEITDKEVPFVLQVSEGTNRPLDERALKFLKTYAKRIEA